MLRHFSHRSLSCIMMDQKGKAKIAKHKHRTENKNEKQDGERR